MPKTITVGITHGDYNGVGYEIIVKALADEKIPELFTPLVFCVPALFEKAVKQFNVEMPKVNVIRNASEATEGVINLVDIGLKDTPLTPGLPPKESGLAAVAALEKAVEAMLNGSIQTLVTAPICKTAVQSDKFNFPGHTEYLADRTGNGAKPLMILFDDYLRVALVTTHLSIKDIPSAITQEAVADAIRRYNSVLRCDFNAERPKIAVLSLNPHCGDNGLLGTEEETAIKPAIEDMLNEGILAFGPFSADGFFATGAYRHYDGVLAMYHDQGLAPFKALAREHGVNFTAGLPFVRTSPDHGTAYDIAWKGEADPMSMREAIYKAIDIYRNRSRFLKASANPLKKARTERGSDKTVDLSKETLSE